MKTIKLLSITLALVMISVFSNAQFHIGGELGKKIRPGGTE
jgi:hypothetical protein